MLFKLLLITSGFLLIFCQSSLKAIVKNTVAPPIIVAPPINYGGIYTVKLDKYISELANWTTTSIASYTGFSGKYSVKNIANVQAQVVSGMYYYLSIE